MYQCLLYSPAGLFRKALSYVSLSGARKQHESGEATIVLDEDMYPAGDIPRDSVVVIVRNGKILSRAIWRVRGRTVERKRNRRTLVLTLRDQTDILARRIIAYRAGNANSTKTGYASDLMVAFFNEQFVSAADPARNVSGMWAEGITGLGPTLTIGASFDNLLSTLRKIHNAALNVGYWVGFGLEPADSIGTLGQFSLVFRVYNNVAGVRRNAAGSAGGVVLSEALGTIANVVIDEDWTSEPSFIYAGGSGQEADRLIAQAQRADLIAASPLGRVERFRDVSNTKTATALQAEADSALQADAGVASFTADVVFGGGLEWDESIGFGDIMPVMIGGKIVSARVESFGFASSRSAPDVITARVAGVLS